MEWEGHAEARIDVPLEERPAIIFAAKSARLEARFERRMRRSELFQGGRLIELRPD